MRRAVSSGLWRLGDILESPAGFEDVYAFCAPSGGRENPLSVIPQDDAPTGIFLPRVLRLFLPPIAS